ncbi:hypothetical protein AAEP93_003607 [Penicillium crustosum]
MPLVQPDSIYRMERSYYLDVLETQVHRLRTNPGRRLQVVDHLKELAQLTPGSIEASLVIGDTVFHQTCCNLQPLYLNAICSLLGDDDPALGYQIADMLEAAVPAES